MKDEDRGDVITCREGSYLDSRQRESQRGVRNGIGSFHSHGDWNGNRKTARQRGKVEVNRY